MGLSELLEPAASIAGREEGVGGDAEESGDSLLPDLQPAAYVCNALNGCGGFTDYGRANAWTFFDTDRSTIRPSAGSKPRGRDEKIRGVKTIISGPRCAAIEPRGRNR